MSVPLRADATISASRHPNGKDLRLTAHRGAQVLGVASVSPTATVGEAIAAMQELEQLAMLHEEPV